MELTLQVAPLPLCLPTFSKGVHDRLEIMVSRRQDQVQSALFGALPHSQTNALLFLREFDLFQQSNQHDHRRKVIANIVNQR